MLKRKIDTELERFYADTSKKWTESEFIAL